MSQENIEIVRLAYAAVNEGDWGVEGRGSPSGFRQGYSAGDGAGERGDRAAWLRPLQP
jgi:hypothetical protein